MPRKNEFGKNVKVLELTDEQIEAAVKRAEHNSKNWTPWPDKKKPKKREKASDE